MGVVGRRADVNVHSATRAAARRVRQQGRIEKGEENAVSGGPAADAGPADVTTLSASSATVIDRAARYRPSFRPASGGDRNTRVDPINVDQEGEGRDRLMASSRRTHVRQAGTERPQWAIQETNGRSAADALEQPETWSAPARARGPPETDRRRCRHVSQGGMRSDLKRVGDRPPARASRQRTIPDRGIAQMPSPCAAPGQMAGHPRRDGGVERREGRDPGALHVAFDCRPEVAPAPRSPGARGAGRSRASIPRSPRTTQTSAAIATHNPVETSRTVRVGPPASNRVRPRHHGVTTEGPRARGSNAPRRHAGESAWREPARDRYAGHPSSVARCARPLRRVRRSADTPDPRRDPACR